MPSAIGRGAICVGGEMEASDAAGMLGALRRAHEEADQLFELAARKDRQLAVALAHRLSSSLEAMRLVIESSAASSSTERRRMSPWGGRLH